MKIEFTTSGGIVTDAYFHQSELSLMLVVCNTLTDDEFARYPSVTHSYHKDGSVDYIEYEYSDGSYSLDKMDTVRLTAESKRDSQQLAYTTFDKGGRGSVSVLFIDHSYYVYGRNK